MKQHSVFLFTVLSLFTILANQSVSQTLSITLENTINGAPVDDGIGNISLQHDSTQDWVIDVESSLRAIMSIMMTITPAEQTKSASKEDFITINTISGTIPPPTTN